MHYQMLTGASCERLRNFATAKTRIHRNAASLCGTVSVGTGGQYFF